MELLDKFCRMFHLRCREPRIFRVWVALPFDQVLDTFSVGSRARLQDLFDLVMFFFSIDNVGRWSSVVGSMGRGFLVWGQQGVVEDRVYTPSLWEDQLTVGRGCGDDLEGAVSSGCQLGLWMRGVDVGSF